LYLYWSDYVSGHRYFNMYIKPPILATSNISSYYQNVSVLA
jgi:hypothetical protein